MDHVRRASVRRLATWLGAATAAAVAAVVLPRLYVADLEEALVREANAVVAAPRLRPSHVDVPRPGTFADALREPLPRYEAAWRRFAPTDELRTLVSAVAKGERPPSDLPPTVSSGLVALEPDLEAVLAASRVERADLGPAHDPFGPFPGTSWLGLQLAARHAAVRIRASAGVDPSRALADCADALGLARDVAIAGGLIGRMVRTAMVGIVAPSCAEAISAADALAVRDAGERLRRIRDAAPPFGAMLREEVIQVQLLALGPRLSSAARDRLLARPRAFADDGSMAVRGALGPLRARLAWRDLRTFQDRLVAAASLSPPEREAAFAALGSAPWVSTLLLGDLDGPDSVAAFAAYARRDAIAELQLDLLVAATAARGFLAREHRWPSSTAELAASGFLADGEARRLSRIVLDVTGAALRFVAPVSGPDAALQEEIVTVRRASPPP